jgi:hypothetical protein
MAGLKLSPYEEERPERYGRVEVKKLGRTVLVQYCVCSSNIPCVRVLGYIPDGARLLPAGLERIAETHRGIVRKCVVVDTASRFSIDAPLVCFE